MPSNKFFIRRKRDIHVEDNFIMFIDITARHTSNTVMDDQADDSTSKVVDRELK